MPSERCSLIKVMSSVKKRLFDQMHRFKPIPVSGTSQPANHHHLPLFDVFLVVRLLKLLDFHGLQHEMGVLESTFALSDYFPESVASQ